MKKQHLLLSTIILLVSLQLGAQKYHIIELENEFINIPDREFYIDTVIDERYNKNTVGIVKKGLFNKKKVAIIKGGLAVSLKRYFDVSLRKADKQLPITLKIKQFEISERTTFANEYAVVVLRLEYYYDTLLLHSTNRRNEEVGLDVTGMHEFNIKKAIQYSLFAFNSSNWHEKVKGGGNSELRIVEKEESKHQNIPAVENTVIEEEINRNVFAIGYQIGGYCAIGVNYEIRFHDYIGVHFGGGLLGYTAGFKIHTNPKKNSPFFNLSYKDGGFGLISVLGIEYGRRFIISKEKDVGVHIQAGLAPIIQIDKDFERQLYNGKSAPDVTFSVGIGISW